MLQAQPRRKGKRPRICGTNRKSPDDCIYLSIFYASIFYLYLFIYFLRVDFLGPDPRVLHKIIMPDTREISQSILAPIRDFHWKILPYRRDITEYFLEKEWCPHPSPTGGWWTTYLNHTLSLQLIPRNTPFLYRNQQAAYAPKLFSAFGGALY